MRARPSDFGCDVAMVAGDDLLFCVFRRPRAKLVGMDTSTSTLGQMSGSVGFLFRS